MNGILRLSFLILLLSSLTFSVWVYADHLVPRHTYFAGMSYSPSTTRYGVSRLQPTAYAASYAASAGCGVRDCQTAWVEGGCLALARNHRGWWISNGWTASAASYSAVQNCAYTTGYACSTVAWVCAY